LDTLKSCFIITDTIPSTQEGTGLNVTENVPLLNNASFLSMKEGNLDSEVSHISDFWIIPNSLP